MMKHRDWIEIPGRPTFRTSIVTPIAVRLPMTLTVRRGWHVAVGLFYLFGALALIIVALLPFTALAAGGGERLLLFGLLLLSVWQAPYWLSAAFRTLRDGLRRGARLIVDGTGLTDTRTGFSAEWKDILSARPLNGRGNEWGVSLEVRDMALLPRSRWLRGFGWLPRRANEIHCQTLGMSEPSYVARAAIFRLVEEAGGAILPPRRAGWFGYSS
jgi:hypothetical protein